MRALAASLALVTSLSAQSKVWVVDAASGPGVDFTQIQAAVQVAADGDSILVRSGSYAPVRITAKSLVVAAETGSAVYISASASPAVPALEVSATGPTQSVTLRGLRAHNSHNQSKGTVWLHDNAGAVWLEQCTAQGKSGTSGSGGNGLLGATIENCAAAVLVDCVIRGGVGQDESAWDFPAGDGGRALLLSASTLSAFDCEIRGGNGGSITWGGGEPAGNGGMGIRSLGTRIFATGGVIQGGAGGKGLSPPDCSGMGGAGIELFGVTAVELLATELAGGPGGPPSVSCPTGAGGIDIFGFGSLTFLPGGFRSLEVSSPLREGEVGEIRLHAFPGELAFVLAAGSPAWTSVPALVGPLVLSPAFSAMPVGPLPEGGSVTLPVIVGDLGPGVQGATAWLQLFCAGELGFALGEASAVLLLDASF